MKQKNHYLIGTLILIVMLLSFVVPAFAASYEVITLPTGQEWATTEPITRTLNYSYALARNHSVFPYSGTDQYELIQCRIVNSAGTCISADSYTILDETDDRFTSVYIRQGYLSYSTIVFEFRGNSSNPATAVVSYLSY